MFVCVVYIIYYFLVSLFFCMLLCTIDCLKQKKVANCFDYKIDIDVMCLFVHSFVLFFFLK